MAAGGLATRSAYLGESVEADCGTRLTAKTRGDQDGYGVNSVRIPAHGTGGTAVEGGMHDVWMTDGELMGRTSLARSSGCSRQAKLLLHDLANGFLLALRQGTGRIHYAVVDEPFVNGLVDFHHLVVRMAMGIHPFFKRSFTAFDASQRIVNVCNRKTFGIRGTSAWDNPISGQPD